MENIRGIVRGENVRRNVGTLDLLAGLQVSTCSGYDLCHVVNTHPGQFPKHSLPICAEYQHRSQVYFRLEIQNVFFL